MQEKEFDLVTTSSRLCMGVPSDDNDAEKDDMLPVKRRQCARLIAEGSMGVRYQWCGCVMTGCCLWIVLARKNVETDYCNVEQQIWPREATLA